MLSARVLVEAGVFSAVPAVALSAVVLVETGVFSAVPAVALSAVVLVEAALVLVLVQGHFSYTGRSNVFCCQNESTFDLVDVHIFLPLLEHFARIRHGL